jgi:ribosomal protein S18 acetylase RimI-like enzyme
MMTTIGKVMQHARKSVYLDEAYVWYELLLGSDRPRLALPPGLMLIRGGVSELPLLDELPYMRSQVDTRLWMESNADLWLVLCEEDRRPAFACWILRDSLPLLATRDGQLSLPPGIVCLEDSATSTSYRGRGIAPAAWSQIADRLEQTEARSIITKIEESNIASRRAIVKCGFREVVTMRFRRVGPKQHTTVRVETAAAANWLVGQLRR